MKKVLIPLFIIVFLLRLYFSLQTPFWSDDSSYFVQRQIETIVDSGFPSFNDDLSYSGRFFFFLPLFHYFIAFLNLFMSIEIISAVVLNLVASSTVFITYYIAKKISSANRVAYFTAFLSGFVPIFFASTVNSLNASTLFIPLSLLLIYKFMDIQKNGKYYLILYFILLLLSPSLLYLMLGFICYTIITSIMRISIGKKQLELIIFSIPFALWFYLILFKNAIQLHGVRIIWQNIPSEVLSRYYGVLSPSEIVNLIGFIPLIAGMISVYLFLSREKNKNFALLVGFSAATFLLLLFRLIPLQLGLMFQGQLLVIMSGPAFIAGTKYFKRTRFSKLNIHLIFLGIFALTSLIPCIVFSNIELQKTISSKESFGIEFLQNITQDNATILTTIYDGHLVSYYANRRNVIDSNFLFASDLNERLEDVQSMYTSSIEPKELFEKYNVDYIYFSDEAREFYNISKISYISGDCPRWIFGTRLATVQC